MKQKPSLAISWWIAVVIIFCIALYVQANIFLSWDVGWHLLDTQRLLHGGNYFKDFFDINPPMIFYLLIPPVFFHQLTGWDSVVIFRVYIFLIAVLSLITSYAFSRRIFSHDESFIHGTFVLSLAVIYVIFPAYEFGQRDPFILLLIIPYFLSVAARATEQQSGACLATWVGILAGLGFSFNLQFLIIFIALEIFLIIKRGSLRIFIRPESLAIVCIVILYILSIITLSPRYMTQELPLVFFLYLDTFNFSWHALLTNVTLLCWVAATVFLVIFWKKYPQHALLTVLYIAASGFFIIFIATRKVWFYHMIPCLAMSSLLLAIFLADSIATLMLTTGTKSFFWATISKTIVLYAILIGLPIVTVVQISYASIKTKSNPNTAINQLIDFVKLHTKRHHAIFVFSTTVTPGGIFIHYADVNLGSRFAGFWMLPGILQREQETLTPPLQVMLKKSQRFLHAAVVVDFKRYRPKLVFVDVAKRKDYFPAVDFNYIAYFSQDAQFKAIWRHYKYVTTIANFAIYSR